MYVPMHGMCWVSAISMHVRVMVVQMFLFICGFGNILRERGGYWIFVVHCVRESVFVCK